MWCDNCLLVLPLRQGAMALFLLLIAYSAGGGFLLVTYGQFWFFTFPEYFLYGGVGFAVAAIAAITTLGFANRSIIWTRAMLFVWPILLMLTAIRCILMIVQLNRTQDKMQWECNNGGQMWSKEAFEGTIPLTGTVSGMPKGFCSAGVASFKTAMTISLLVDLVLQIYAWFLTWRYSAFLTEYRKVSSPNQGFYA